MLGRRELAAKRSPLTADSAFAERHYLEASRYADALQLLVTEQVGRTGHTLGKAAPSEVHALAEQIKEAEIEVEYGLRSTMPAVGLPDEGVSKDPFYILSYVVDEAILPPSSPFEVARLTQAFNALVFKPLWRRISVDLDWSLRRCVAVATPGGQGPRLLWQQTPDGSSPADYYIKACGHFKQLVQLPLAVRERLMATQYPLLPNGGCSASHLLLAYGPLALIYCEIENPDVARPVMDGLRNGRVVLPEQWYLVLLPARSAQEGWAYLEAAGAAGFDSEIVYDSERPMSDRRPGMVLLDRQAGAVWEVWEQLREKEWLA